MIVMKTIVKIPIGYISSVDFAYVYAWLILLHL